MTNRSERTRTPATWLATVALLALLPCATPAFAAEANTNCLNLITDVPFNVDAPGTFCLGANVGLSTDETVAVTISTDNVVLDCNGYRLDGTLATGNTTGISGTNRRNVVVRNCRVRGFDVGIMFTGGAGNLVERNRIDASQVRGLYLDGDGSIARDNQIYDTGGSPTAGVAEGMFITGSTDAIGNVVDGVAPAGASSHGWGISAYYVGSAGGTIARNRVRNVAGSGTGLATGISVEGGSARISVRENDVVDTGNGQTGLICHGPNQVRVRDNTLSGWNGAISGCVSASGNVIRP